MKINELFYQLFCCALADWYEKILNVMILKGNFKKGK